MSADRRSTVGVSDRTPHGGRVWPTLRVERRAHGVLDVHLDRPAQRNAIDLQMCLDLASLFDGLRFEPELAVVCLRGTGTAFCAGVDTRELALHDAAWGLTRRNRGLDAYLAIERCPAPVIALVHGPAIGGGAEMALACDFVVATHAARFQWPEALRGGVGATQRLPRIVGMPMAKELLFTGRTLSAQEALAIGVVNHAVPDADLEATASALVERMRAADAVALRGIKQAMNAGEACTRPAAVDIERQAIAWAMASREAPRGHR